MEVLTSQPPQADRSVDAPIAPSDLELVQASRAFDAVDYSTASLAYDQAATYLRPLASHASLVVEVGTGAGGLLRPLRQIVGRRLVGCDISLRQTKLSKAYAPTCVCACEALAFGSGCADGVVLYGVIEHTVSPAWALRECYRILRPGGWFFIMTDNLLWEKVTQWRNAVLPRSRRCYKFEQPIDRAWSPWGFQRLIRQAGFQIVEYRGMGTLPILGRLWSRLMDVERLPGVNWFTCRMWVLAKKP